jgi:dTMP kinase
MSAGRFIVFEGIDGSGKSSQLKHLALFLEREGEVVQTREPYDKAIRELLQARGTEDYSPLAQLFLFSASRTMHYKEIIEPAKKRGATILCDRWTDSTLAYQGFGLGLDQKVVAQQNALSTNGTEPDIVFLMDIPIDKMFARLKTRGDALSSYEKLGHAFFERVRLGYLEIAKKSNVYQVINGDRPEAEIAAQIKERANA